MKPVPIRQVPVIGWLTSNPAAAAVVWASLPIYTARVQLPGGGFIQGVPVGRPVTGSPFPTASPFKYVPLPAGTFIHGVAEYAGDSDVWRIVRWLHQERPSVVVCGAS